jgi:hypothetical protein
MAINNTIKKVIITSLVIGFVSIKFMSNKSIKEKITGPSLAQYLNRLKEFYDHEIMYLVEDKFLTFVDFGISPEAAFEILIEEGV